MLIILFAYLFAYIACANYDNESRISSYDGKNVAIIDKTDRSFADQNNQISSKYKLVKNMSDSDKILVFTTLFLGLCALFAPYFAELMKRYKFAPKLDMLFNLSPPSCHKTTFNRIEPVYYFRVQIENNGKSQAKQCEVLLENLWIYNSENEPIKYENFSSVHLKWSVIHNDFININPNRKNLYCDFCHISSPNYQANVELKNPNYNINFCESKREKLHFVLDTVEILYAQPNRFGPGKYILQIGLYSENAGYKTEFFEISWSGIWQNDIKDMFKEMVIKQTTNPQ